MAVECDCASGRRAKGHNTLRRRRHQLGQLEDPAVIMTIDRHPCCAQCRPERNLVRGQDGFSQCRFQSVYRSNRTQAVAADEHDVGIVRHISAHPFKDFLRAHLSKRSRRINASATDDIKSLTREICSTEIARVRAEPGRMYERDAFGAERSKCRRRRSTRQNDRHPVCPFLQAPPGWVVCVRPQGVTATCIGKHDRMRRQIGKSFGRSIDMRRLGECRRRPRSDHARRVNRHPGGANADNSDSGTGSKSGVNTPMRARSPAPSRFHVGRASIACGPAASLIAARPETARKRRRSIQHTPSRASIRLDVLAFRRFLTLRTARTRVENRPARRASSQTFNISTSRSRIVAVLTTYRPMPSCRARMVWVLRRSRNRTPRDRRSAATATDSHASVPTRPCSSAMALTRHEARGTCPTCLRTNARQHHRRTRTAAAARRRVGAINAVGAVPRIVPGSSQNRASAASSSQVGRSRK